MADTLHIDSAALLARYSQTHLLSPNSADTERFYTYLENYSHGLSGPVPYPGLRPQPFHAPEDFPIVRALQDAYGGIQAEILALDGAKFHNETEMVHRTGSWNVLMLFERGKQDEAGCALCPITTRLVEQHRTLRTIAGLIYVSRMAPGTHIAPHCGPTNIRVRCHLGIQVPEGECGLRVGAEIRHWKEGHCLVFDDSFEHESWNHTASQRIVLIVDLWHPDLSETEIRLLRGLHHYTSLHADNLSRYWRANARAKMLSRKQYD